jgi:hypothetical protein
LILAGAGQTEIVHITQPPSIIREDLDGVFDRILLASVVKNDLKI